MRNNFMYVLGNNFNEGQFYASNIVKANETRKSTSEIIMQVFRLGIRVNFQK